MPVDAPDQLREILIADTIAVVGCSSTPGKAAHDVPKYLHERGYDVISVNPSAEEIWTQSGIRDDEAAARAEATGRAAVQDHCMKVAHKRLAA